MVCSSAATRHLRLHSEPPSRQRLLRRRVLFNMIADSDAWDAADAQALQAALASMDDWDWELTALFASDGDNACPPKNTKAGGTKCKAPYKRPRVAWKTEMAALREQLEEMDGVVAEQNAVGTKPPFLEAEALGNEWARLARTQESRRIAAEVENAKLRKYAEEQVKIVNQMLGLTKRVKLLEDVFGQPPVISMGNYLGPRIDAHVQLRQLDVMVEEAAKIFSSSVFAQYSCQRFREVNFREATPTENGVELEFQASWMLPFAVDRVAYALWSQTNRPTFEDKKMVYKDLYEDANSLVTQFISSAGPNDWWGGSHGTSAARMVPETSGDGSVLIVVKSRARAYANGQCQGSGDVDGWLRIQPVSFEAQLESQHISRVQWYRQTRLGPPEDAALSKSERIKWTNTVTTSATRSRFEQDLDWSVQAIDNLLLASKTT